MSPAAVHEAPQVLVVDDDVELAEQVACAVGSA